MEMDYFNSLDYLEKYKILDSVNKDSLIKVLIQCFKNKDLGITSSSINQEIRKHYATKENKD